MSDERMDVELADALYAIPSIRGSHERALLDEAAARLRANDGEPEEKTDEELAAALKEKFGKVPKWFQRYTRVPIGTRIMANRKKADLTQVQLAARVGCMQSTISQIESGKRKPSYGLAERLLESCGARLIVSPTDDGERIEGWASRKGIFKQKLTPNQVCPNVHMWTPAFLTILHTPKESKGDE